MTQGRVHRILLVLLLVLVLTAPGGGEAQAQSAAEGEWCEAAAHLAATRPGPEGTPTEVAIGIYLIDLMAIDDAAQTFTADFYFVVSWLDPRLAAAALGGSLAACQLQRAQVWHPRVDVVNQRDLASSSDDAVSVDDVGQVENRRRFYGELQAPLDVRDFPFDHQTLKITVASFGYSPEEVAFVVDEERTGRRTDVSVAGWSIEVEEPRIGSEYLPSVDRRVSRFDFLVGARRHSGFYVWKMLVPLVLIVFMAWTVFWIHPKHLGPQIGVATATVFTLIAFHFSLGRLLPPVSYLTRADKFLLGSMLLVFLTLGEAIAAGKLADSGHEELSLRVDRWARFIYVGLVVLLVSFTLW